MGLTGNEPISTGQIRELLQQGTVPRKDGRYSITSAMLQSFLEKHELESVLAGYGLKITTHRNGVRVIDCGVLEVDTDTDVDAQLEALGLVRFSPRVTTENFHFKKQGKRLIPLQLINMGRAVLTLARAHLSDGNLLEMLAIYKAFPELAKTLWMLSPASILYDKAGALVPVLDSRGDECGVKLCPCGSRWGIEGWFVTFVLPVNEQATTAPNK